GLLLGGLPALVRDGTSEIRVAQLDSMPISPVGKLWPLAAAGADSVVAGEVEDAGGERLVLPPLAVLAGGHGVAGNDEMRPHMRGGRSVRCAGVEQKALEGRVVADQQALAGGSTEVQRDQIHGDGGINRLPGDAAAFLDALEGLADGRQGAVRQRGETLAE